MLRAEPLAKRLAGNQRLELADEVGLKAKGELGVDPLFEGREAEFLETGALVPAERFRELGE